MQRTVASAHAIATMSDIDAFEREAQALDAQIATTCQNQDHEWYAKIGPALYSFVERHFNCNDVTRLTEALIQRFAEKVPDEHKDLLRSAWRAETIRQNHMKADNLTDEQKRMVPYSTYHQLNWNAKGCVMNTVNLRLFYEMVRV